MSSSMSVLSTRATDERRRSARLTFREPLPVRVGRWEGVVVDFGEEGARVRHIGALKLGTELRMALQIGAVPFVVNARVLACRVIGLHPGAGGGTMFESRFVFIESAADAIERLEREMRNLRLVQ